MRSLWLVLALVSLVLMGTGLRRGEWTVVKRHADTLCTACIGLTAGPGHERTGAHPQANR